MPGSIYIWIQSLSSRYKNKLITRPVSDFMQTTSPQRDCCNKPSATLLFLKMLLMFKIKGLILVTCRRSGTISTEKPEAFSVEDSEFLAFFCCSLIQKILTQHTLCTLLVWIVGLTKVKDGDP